MEATSRAPESRPRVRTDRDLRTERAAVVGLLAQQHRLPERRDPRHVRLEIEPRHVGEDEADDRVGQRPPVERAHQPLAVGAALDVVAHAITMAVSAMSLRTTPLSRFGLHR